MNVRRSEPQRARWGDVEAVNIVLQRLDPAGIVDLGVHGVGVEEHRTRQLRMMGVGGGVGEEVPELLAAAPIRLRRTPQIRRGPVEEFGDLVVLLPGRRWGQVVAVLLLEPLLFLGIGEQVQPVVQDVLVAVDGLREIAAIPHHQPVAVDRQDVVPGVGPAHRGGHVRQIGGEIRRIERAKGDDVELALARDQGGEIGLVKLIDRKFQNVDLAAGLLFPALGG